MILFLLFALTLQCASSAVAAEETVVVPAKKRPTVALALGGGGTRGVAHVGVLRVLQKEGIPIDYIAGTSMGAIVGGLFSAGCSTEEIEDRLLNKSLLHSFNTVPIPVRLAVVPIFFVPHVFGYHPLDGLYRGKKFASYLNKAVPESRRQLEELKIPFCAVASNLLDGKPYAITTGNLGEALQASSAIPVLRKPVQLGDKLLVDGGISANLPCRQARAMGADIVIGVDVDEDFQGSTDKEFHHIFSVAPRAVSVILSSIDESQRKEADIIIHPDVNGIRLLSGKKAVGLRALEAGMKAAEAAIPAIKARLGQAKIAGGEECSPQPPP
jgi:NTE family protein